MNEPNYCNHGVPEGLGCPACDGDEDFGMDAKAFELLTGYPPENDDLERVNCKRAGELGHFDCGLCRQCDMPRFMCACNLQTPLAGRL
jgi:hypothetical protein